MCWWAVSSLIDRCRITSLARCVDVGANLVRQCERRHQQWNRSANSMSVSRCIACRKPHSSHGCIAMRKTDRSESVRCTQPLARLRALFDAYYVFCLRCRSAPRPYVAIFEVWPWIEFLFHSTNLAANQFVGRRFVVEAFAVSSLSTAQGLDLLCLRKNWLVHFLFRYSFIHSFVRSNRRARRSRIECCPISHGSRRSIARRSSRSCSSPTTNHRLPTIDVLLHCISHQGNKPNVDNLDNCQW